MGGMIGEINGKIFCDKCDKQVEEDFMPDIELGDGKHNLSITISLSGYPNNDLLCESCALVIAVETIKEFVSKKENP